MASTKELFYKGLCYDYTKITNLENDIAEYEYALSYVKKPSYRRKLLAELENLKTDLYNTKRVFKNFIKYFGYTSEDLNGKFKPRYLTEAELEADLIRDEKESHEKIDYKFEDILKKAHELDKQKAEQQVEVA